MSIGIEEQLKTDGYFVSTTSGYSMRPMLRDRRDRVVLRATEADEILKRGAIPLYRLPDGRYVLHRVLSYKDGKYRIRGDNTYVTETVPKEWIVGVVSEFYRGERHVKVTSRRYRAYVVLWRWLYPVRFLWHKVRTFASKIKHRLIK
ncbi:MAG: S24/S26 family peptidase [Clostridia bacterium]|nr:S24/S26 family peptidase [Clostridia bacterium]